MPASPKTRPTSQSRATVFTLLIVFAVPAWGSAEPVDIEGTLTLAAFLDSDRGPEEPPRRLFDMEFRSDRYPLPIGSVSRLIEVVGSAGDTSTIDIVRPSLPNPLEAGAVIDTSARVTWNGGFVLDCCPVTPDLLPIGSGSFEIAGGPAVLSRHPLAAAGDVWLIGSAPFVLAGVISALDRTTGALLSSQDVRGRGIVHIAVFAPDRFSYLYELQPVPEPATMALFGLGAAGLAARRCLTRRRQR